MPIACEREADLIGLSGSSESPSAEFAASSNDRLRNCRREGFEILERFKEEGESAKTADRTKLQRLLTFCRTNKGQGPLRRFFNLTRFARDTPSPEGYGVQASTTTSRSVHIHPRQHQPSLMKAGEGCPP
jgi:hypothetical protein